MRLQSLNRALRVGVLAAALLTLLAAGLSAGPVSAQPFAAPDIRSLPPVVMFVLDNSGSMERQTQCTCTSTTCSECLPDCSMDQPNRWNLIVEALTGEFIDFGCSQIDRNAPPVMPADPDYNYFIPHFQVTFTSQVQNGIIDTYGDRARMALATFDNVPTLTGQSQLVAYNTMSTGAGPGQSAGIAGHYSYGPLRSLVFPGSPAAPGYGVNNGIRSDNPVGGSGAGYEGNLHPPGSDATYLAVHTSIQTSLATIRPYGPSPIAGALEDTEHFFTSHPSVLGGAGGDPYAACRGKYVVLLTDGYPNADYRDPVLFGDGVSDCGGAGTCPYDTPLVTSARMCTYSGTECTGVVDGVFVVGFDVSATDPGVVTVLNDIAVAGGTDNALFADDLTTLNAALSSVIDDAASGTTTRTLPAYTDNEFGANTAQYQFNSGFEILPDIDEPWEGILERTRYTCTGTSVVQNPVDAAQRDVFHETLTAQPIATRRIYTAWPAGGTNVTEWITGDGVAELTADSLPIPSTALGAPAEEGVDAILIEDIPGVDLAAAIGITVGEADSLRNNWIYGMTRTNRLSDVYHSSPKLHGPPTADRPDQSYNEFRRLVEDRPTVMYVGTNDGVLHAFCVSPDGCDNGTLSFDVGEEIWGFIPPVLIPRLDTAAASHQIMVDGSPVVQDVLRVRLALSDPNADEYRSVLVVGLRKGGAAYIALDVTDPMLGPKFLWQYVDADMGATYGEAGLGNVLVDVNSTLSERGIAVLPGGLGEQLPSTCAAAVGVTDNLVGSQRNSRNCYLGNQGQSMYVLDVTTGRLLQKFDNTVIDGPLSGGVGLFSGEIGEVATSAYASDQDGMIWRLDMHSSDAALWEVTPFHDMFYNEAPAFWQPAYHAPVVTTDNQGRVVIIQGTGNIDDFSNTETNRVASITEKIDLNPTTGDYDPSSSDLSAELNWEIVFDPSEQVTGPIELFAGTAYWSTFRSSNNPLDLCQLGDSSIWGVEYLTGNGAIEGPPTVFSREQPNLAGILTGVSVTRRPSCITGINVSDPYLGNYYAPQAQGGGGYQLVSQASAGTTTGDSSIPVQEMSLPAPITGTHVQSEATRVR